MHDTQVTTKFGQFKITKLPTIIYDDNSQEVEVKNNRFSNKVFYSSFCNFGKKFDFHLLCEVVYGYKQELLLS